MNGTLTRDEIDALVTERLRIPNTRLDILETIIPKAANIAKVLDGHHHMESVELFDENVTQKFGYQLDFRGQGVIAHRETRKHVVEIGGTGVQALSFAQGTYIGNGGSQVIQVGFTPKVVVIKDASGTGS